MLSTTYSRIPKNKLRPRKKINQIPPCSHSQIKNHFNSSVYIPPEFYLFTAREKSSNCISTTAPSLIQHRQLQEFHIPNPIPASNLENSDKAYKFLKNKSNTIYYKNFIQIQKIFVHTTILLNPQELNFDQLKAILSLNYICLFPPIYQLQPLACSALYSSFDFRCL